MKIFFIILSNLLCVLYPIHLAAENLGRDVNYGQFPALIALLNDQEKLVCTGSLLTTLYVLTCGHCFTLDLPEFALGGDIYISNSNATSRQIRRFSNVILHPNFSDENTLRNKDDFDIALVKVNVPFKLSNDLQVIALCSDDPEIRSTCFTAGWGHSAHEPEDTFNKLQYHKTEIIDTKYCQWKSNWTFDFICTQSTNNSLAHNGDSGGPLICNNKQCAILAYDYQEANKYVLKKITKFSSWISNITGIPFRNFENEMEFSLKRFARSEGCRFKIIFEHLILIILFIEI